MKSFLSCSSLHLRLSHIKINISRTCAMSSAKGIRVAAILFDMDGTLIDSTPGVLKAWEIFSKDYHLGDSRAIADATHGRRLYDTLKEYCGITDEVILSREIDRFEDAVIEGGPLALPGVIALLSQLDSQLEPVCRWTIVTSASNGYAPRALERSRIPLPKVGLITSNDVPYGKPHPAPYLAGALRCGVDPSMCLVVEDAISGLKSGRAAGAMILAVCTSTPRQVIMESDVNPDFVVSDLTKVTIKYLPDGMLEVTIDES